MNLSQMMALQLLSGMGKKEPLEKAEPVPGTNSGREIASEETEESPYRQPAAIQFEPDRDLAAMRELAFKDQVQGLRDNEAALKEFLNRPKKVDLSPLVALSDAWNPGSRMAQAYRAPANEEERAIEDMKAREGIQKQREDVVSAINKNSLDGMLARLAATQGRYEDKKAAGTFEKYHKALQDALGGEQLDLYKESNQLLDSLAQGFTQNVETAASLISRMYGQKGVLTDKDIKYVLGDTFEGNVAKFKQWITSKPTKYPPLMREKLEQMAQIGRKNLSAKIANSIELPRGQYELYPELDFSPEGRATKMYNVFKQQFEDVTGESFDEALSHWKNRGKKEVEKEKKSVNPLIEALDPGGEYK